MKITIIKGIEDPILALKYPVNVGETYNSNDVNCPITIQDMDILQKMDVASNNDDIVQLKNVAWKPKKYKKNCAVFKGNCTYVSNQKTSNIWIRTEWDLVSGIEDYISGIVYKQDNEVFKTGSICQALVDTSDTWVDSEWVTKI